MYFTIPSGLVVVLIIVLLLLVAMMLVLYVVKTKHDAVLTISEIADELQTLHENRYVIATDLITAFSENTEADERFKSLVASYPEIDSDEKEAQWEKVYIPAVKSFMKRAKKHAAPNMEQAVDLAYEQLDENERALVKAQEKLNVAIYRRGKLDKGVWRIIGIVGDKLINGVKIGENAVKHGREIYQRAKDGDENIWVLVEEDKIKDTPNNETKKNWREMVSEASSKPIVFVGDGDDRGSNSLTHTTPE